jgi:hypothetical protein
MEDVDAVLRALDRVVDRALEEGDRRGYFAVLYRTVTARVKTELEAGTFDDVERMHRLDVLFAQRYLDALDADRDGGALIRSWALTFDAAPGWRPLILQHLLVGINAHINLDLGIAAARCSPGHELPDLQRDYDRVNAILAAMVAKVQANLVTVSPWIGWVERFGGRAGDELVRFSIVVARTGAWRYATDLTALPEDRWDASIAARDTAVARVGRRVLHPGVWLSAGLLAVRFRERSDVREVIQALAAVPPPTTSEVDAGLQVVTGAADQDTA